MAHLKDTSPEIEKLHIELVRSSSTYQRFALLEDLMMTGRKLTLARLRDRFPAAGAAELHRRLATIILGPELAAKVYGPEPDPPTL